MNTVKENPRKISLIIRCECGVRIPLIGNPEEMGRQIEEHAEVHDQKKNDLSKGQDESNRIQDLLMKQVFQKICELDI